MKKIPFVPAVLLIAFCATAFSACEGEKNNAVIRKIVAKIDNNGAETREYDSSNRIIQVSKGPGNYMSYSYGANEITLTIVQNHTTSYTNKLLLNNEGYVVEWYNNLGGLYATYQYDAEGYMTQTDYYDQNGVYDVLQYAYDGGNLVSITAFTISGIAYATTTYQYDDHENTLANENFGITYLGKSNKNLQKWMLRSNTMGNTTRLDSAFELDGTGLVVKEHQDWINGGVSFSNVISYTYEGN